MTRIGEGKYRITRREGERLQVRIPSTVASALCQIRTLEGLDKSEVVTVALDIVLALPQKEIARLVEKRRNSDL